MGFGSEIGHPGDSIEIPVTLTGTPDDELHGVELLFRYDSTILTEPALTTSGSLTADWLSALSVAGDTLHLALADDEGFDAAGTVTVVRFTVSDGAGVGTNIDLEMLAATLETTDGSTQALDLQNGTFRVAAQPAVWVNTGLTLTEGTTATVDNSHLESRDSDNGADELTYTLVTAPSQGVLRNGGVLVSQGGSFTQKNLNDGALDYTHTGSSNTDSFDFEVSDGSGTPLSGSFTIVAVAPNAAPVLDNSGVMTLQSLDIDEFDSGGDLVSTILASAGGDRIQDADGDPDGVALVGADNGNGTWQYSTDGGASWVDVGVVWDQAAVLLSGDQRLRFVPLPGWFGTAEIQFRAWDGSTGASGDTGVDARNTGESSSFSEAVQTVSIRANIGPEITTNTGLTVVAGLTTTISTAELQVTDGDNEPAEITFTLVTGPGLGFLSNGGDRIDEGGSFTQGDIDAGLVGYNYAGALGTDGFTFSVTDGLGTPVTGSFALEAVTVNAAPVLDNSAAMQLKPIDQDNVTSGGTSISDIVASAGGDRIQDADGDPEGIAVIAADNTNGDWQYSTDGGARWLNLAALSEEAAVLLAEDQLIRFVPDIGWFGNAEIEFRAWDRTEGESGDTGVDAGYTGTTSPFSEATQTATIAVLSSNIDRDGQVVAAAGIAEPVSLVPLPVNFASALGVLDFTIRDGGTMDGVSLDVSQILVHAEGGVSLEALTFLLDGPDALSVTGMSSDEGLTVTFGNLAISVADGTEETYTVSFYYNGSGGIRGGDHLALSLDGDVDFFVAAEGTRMTGNNGTVSTGAGSEIIVKATALEFIQQPGGAFHTLALEIQPVVAAVGENGLWSVQT